MGDSGASSRITHKKKDTIDVEKFEINVTVGNGQKMKCELKVSVNRKLQDGQTVNLTKVLYVPQAVNVFECIKVCFKGRYDGGYSG